MLSHLVSTMHLRLPHPLVLLLGGVAVAVALTWVVPAGTYQRRTDAASGRAVVIPGTYARVAASPVGPMAALMAVPRGIVAGADVILVVLFVGGAFGLLDATGALARLVGSLVGRTRQPRIIIVLVCLAFATLGALENMHEEIIALVPVLLVLSRGLGFGAITALAMSVGVRGRRLGVRSDEPVPDRHRAAVRRNAGAQPAGTAVQSFRRGRRGLDRVDAGDGVDETTCART